MAKDPAFLFYPNDYIGGTMGMTFEEKGAYIELLMLQFNRGHMDGHMIGHCVGQIWERIKSKFIQDENGLWFNERLDIEKDKRKAFTQSRRNNIKGINQHMKGHMTKHMENENVNENIDINKSNKEEKVEKKIAKPNMAEVIEFFKLNGYSDIAGIKAFNYYNEAGWKDSKGNKVLNWKQKMRGVWFKDENKSKNNYSINEF